MPDNSQLEKNILLAIEKPELINSMKINCYNIAGKYMPDGNIKKIVEKLKL